MKQILVSLILAISINSEALCLDQKIDSKAVKLVQEAAKSILDPKNEKAVPAGLPEGNYPVRSLEVIATISGNALVFVMFTDAKGSPGFMSPYSFVNTTKVLKQISIPDLGNNDSRFWDIKTKILNACKNPKIKITYDACLACGDGDDLVGHFNFDESDSNWSFEKSSK